MSFFRKLNEGLKKTSTQLSDAFTKVKLDEEALDRIEERLILSDIGAGVAASIRAEIAEGRYDKTVSGEEVKQATAEAIAKRLTPYAKPLELPAHPSVVLVVGVNGNGKTATIGKLAHYYRAQGKKILLVAGDTFRAAAAEQLELWAKRTSVDFLRGAEGGDPAALAYQGVERAMKEKADLVLIDTAGRLHTQANLMAELEKILKVIRKLMPDAPHHVIQVLDATTGQNAISQVKAFRETAGVTGLVVTKLDGTAKAGIVVALAEQFKLPIHAIGVGEQAEDLQPFDAAEFARALVGFSDSRA